MTTLADIQRHLGVPADGRWGPVTAAAIAKAIGYAPVAHKLSDPAKFFAAVRQITGGLDQVQVDSINNILKLAARHPLSWVAYELATAWHEARFKPQPEWGKGKGRRYAKPGARMNAVPNPPLYGGQIPYGRGLVQITWCDNYEWLDEAAAEAGLIEKGAILKDFDLALRPDIAALALVKGMEEGAFGKKLSQVLPDRRATVEQFTNARPTVNVMDKAALIAGHAVEFQDAAEQGGWA
jgi:putative chitinase